MTFYLIITFFDLIVYTAPTPARTLEECIFRSAMPMYATVMADITADPDNPKFKITTGLLTGKTVTKDDVDVGCVSNNAPPPLGLDIRSLKPKLQQGPGPLLQPGQSI